MLFMGKTDLLLGKKKAINDSLLIIKLKFTDYGALYN